MTETEVKKQTINTKVIFSIHEVLSEKSKIFEEGSADDSSLLMKPFKIAF